MADSHRHNRSYYMCWPRNNNRGHPDKYAGHPKAVYIREDALLDAVSRFFADRSIRPHRRDILAAPSIACTTPARSAAECERAPEPLGEVEQLRLALEECGGSVAELSRQSGHTVEDVRALLEAEDLIGPKLRRGSLTAEQLHSAGRDYAAGASLRELAKSYGVGATYLRLHPPRRRLPSPHDPQHNEPRQRRQTERRW